MLAATRASAVLAALAGAAACGGGAGRGAGARDTRPLVLSLPLVDGGDIDVARYRGEIVVLHLFTTWSLAAQSEVEQMTAAHATEGVEVIGIGLDPDGARIIAPWRNASEIPYLVAVAGPAVREGRSALGKIAQVPTTLVLDRDGRIAHRVERPLRPGELARLVASARSSR